MECYNITTEEEEDPRKIDIAKSEGHREVNGPKIEMPNLTKPLKTKNVNIGSEDGPKFATIVDYWDEDTITKIVNHLHEYPGLFPLSS